MTIGWIPALLFPAFAGFCLAALVSGRRGVFSAALGLGLGFGAATLLAYPFLIASGLSGASYLWMETAAVLILGFGFLRCRARQEAPSAPPWRGTDRVLLAVFGLTALLAGYVFLRVSLAFPDGTWDAWSNWNLIPRFIHRAGRHWQDRHVFAPAMEGHPYDYPMLLALSVARIWKWVSAESTAGPILIAASFTLSTAGLLYAALAALTDRRQGLLAATLLIGTPNYLNIATAQYADIPLAFFIMASVALLCLAEREPAHSRGLLIAAGLAAGLAAWTKNEGLAFLLAFGLARLAASIIGRRSGLLREAAAVGAGLLLPAAVVVHFKYAIAQPSHFTNSLPVMLAFFADANRHLQSFSYMLTCLGPLSALALYLLLMGRRPGALQKTGVQTGLIACVLMLLGYHLMFVCMTPVAWGLKLSVDLNWERIVLHIWPLFLLTFFQIAASPALAAAKPENGGVGSFPAGEGRMPRNGT